MSATKPKHLDVVLEDEIVSHLTAPGGGWIAGDPSSYDKELALDPAALLAFIQATQPVEWAKYIRDDTGDRARWFLKGIAQQLDTHGTLHVLRRGATVIGAHFRLCAFKPAHPFSALTAAYAANRLTVVRQLHHSLYRRHDAIDLVLFVNGIPVATAELTTDTTQTVQHAIAQYMTDRLPMDPRIRQPEPLLQFKSRALVHFAVSCDEVWMTTRLQGANTTFRPFSLGVDDGAGNPTNPSGRATSYLWERIWQRDNWLNILGCFMHAEKAKTTLRNGKATTSEHLIFPRVHQWEAVTQLVDAAKADGAGHTYLIQHSAGSGKSYSIGWLAHRLSFLLGDDNRLLFNTTVVVTDRKILDNQLQKMLLQLEQTPGMVQRIDKDSNQLAAALNGGQRIIVTTLQKFAFVLKKVGDNAARRFAVIVDEAHSSQAGTAAAHLQRVLSAVGRGDATAKGCDDGLITAADGFATATTVRQQPQNVTYFAFTATPKPITMELFGRPGANGIPKPFHVYSIRQAIEEGYAHDVLRHYVSYNTFVRLATEGVASESSIDSSPPTRDLAPYVQRYPTTITHKASIVVEHFRGKVAQKIGGRAKAMVVTGSRREAVQWKLAIDRYLAEQQYADVGTLVAFSGSIADVDSGPLEFTEATMNPALRGQSVEYAFATNTFSLLIVANKFLAGFDQPLLHTMYVDKNLQGPNAVQTLSRLNRTALDKEDTFILDFSNDPDQILAAFRQYDSAATLTGEKAPRELRTLQTRLDASKVCHTLEVDAFAASLYDPKSTLANMQAALQPAAGRWRALKGAAREEFRSDLGRFVSLYAFLAHILSHDDVALENLASFGRMLLPRLASAGDATADVIESATLRFFREQKRAEVQFRLEPGAVGSVEPTTSVEEIRHFEVIEAMKALFYGDLTEADLVDFVRAIIAHLITNRTLTLQAVNNSQEMFAIGDYPKVLCETVIHSLSTHSAMATQILKSERVRKAFGEIILAQAYDALRQTRSTGVFGQPSMPHGALAKRDGAFAG